MHELVDLVPYTEYSIKVQAVNENGPGVFSRDIVVRTYSAQPTQPPHNVTVEPVSPTVRIIFRVPQIKTLNNFRISLYSFLVFLFLEHYNKMGTATRRTKWNCHWL